ncbi:WD40-repeat-containing domain protein [Spinellus fusiger]|nr:WD40-repeat-containing domain protein [Spinellus fusiger]
MKKKSRDPRLVVAQTLPTLPGSYTVPSETLSDETDGSNPQHNAIWTMKFSKDGRYLATGGQSAVVLVWKAMSEADEQGKGSETISVFDKAPARVYRGHSADILDLSWSKTKFLLSSSMDKTVRLWHITRQECLCVFKHLDFVTSVVFHPRDDRFFLSGSLDCKIRLWSIPEKKVTFWNEAPDGNMITAVGFTLDGKTVCAGSYIGQCFFYDTDGLKYNTQMSVSESKNPKKGRKITGIEAMPGISAGDEMLLITSNDSKVRLYNMRDKSMMYKYKGPENGSMQIRASFSDDGQYIICGSEDGSAYVWETKQSSASPFHHLLSHEPAEHSTRLSGWLKRGERRVHEKLRHRPDHFEAHDHATTVAIFAPSKTRMALARTENDWIFNRTPIHYPPNTVDPQGDSNNEDALPTSTQSALPLSPSTSSSFVQAFLDFQEGRSSIDSQAGVVYASELYKAGLRDAREKFTYPDGHIIVSADHQGEVKVWRIDCSAFDEGKRSANDNVFSHTLTRHRSVEAPFDTEHAFSTQAHSSKSKLNFGSRLQARQHAK